MSIGLICYILLGTSVLLPLGAHIAGNEWLARRLGVLPTFSFGLVSIVFGFMPGATFSSGFSRYPDSWKPLSADAGRPAFLLFGLLLIGMGIRIIIKKDYDRPSSDD